ncbi:hypothetical protein [Halopiger goleimassiliensis]|uniref:hypothetical protein n=1 Tax=Halopiger goleimassiliensis TaxID=1293048 RepID=UPI001E538596|nr:hypothetical protein [Halopiger goleimassiliensis]
MSDSVRMVDGSRTGSETDVDGETAVDADDDADDLVRVWMVERTFSADSPNIMMITYATTDGARYYQQERAYNRFGARGAPTVTAAVDVDADRLAPVADDETRDRYAREAERMKARHDPDESV